MKNLRIFLSEKKLFMYFILLPVIFIVLVNTYTVKKFEKEMQPSRVGIIIDEGLKEDQNMLQSLLGIAQNAMYKDIFFVKYDTYENLNDAEKALNKNEIDMYLKVDKRDLKTFNEKLQAYTAGDKKTLTDEDLGAGLKMTLKANKVNRSAKLFKTYIETIAKDAKLQRYVLKNMSQEEIMKKIEENQFKKIVMAGMPYQFLLDGENKMLSQKLGNKLEDKYIKDIEEFLKENTRDVKKIQTYMKEYQKFQYKGAKEESLKQNIPTDEQLKQREKQMHESHADHIDHKSMMIADAKEDENKKIEEELKRTKEEEEKQEQRKEAQDRLQKEQTDEKEKIAREVFFKLDNGKRIYALTFTLAIIVFMQGILNIKYFERKEKLSSIKKDSLRNVKQYKIMKKHMADFFVAFFMNLLFTIVFYFVIVSLLKISAGISYFDKKGIKDIFGYLKSDLPKYFEFNTLYISFGINILYTLIITKISYFVYITLYNKSEKFKINIYILLGLIFVAAAFLYGIILRFNFVYLYVNGMYLLRYNGVNRGSIANLIALSFVSICFGILNIISFELTMKKIRKEEKALEKEVQNV